MKPNYRILKKLIPTFLAVGILFSISACSKYDVELERSTETEAIRAWLESTYDLTPEEVITDESIYYIHGKTGIGTVVMDATADSVEIAFDAYLLENNKLTQVYSYTRTEPFVYTQGMDLVSGFESGISGMREGDTALFIVPFDLAYGPADNGPIPGFSTLVFQINYITVYMPEITE